MSDDEQRPRRLTTLPRALNEEGYVPIDYRVMREAAVNRAFPAHQINGIWHYNPKDTAAIATALQLKRTAPANTQTAAA